MFGQFFDFLFDFDVLTQDPSRMVREGLRSIPNHLKYYCFPYIKMNPARPQFRVFSLLKKGALGRNCHMERGRSGFALLCCALLCIALICIALLCFALLCFSLHCFALLCTAVICIALLFIAVICIALLCFALL